MSIADMNVQDKSESSIGLTAQVEGFVRQSAAEGCDLGDFDHRFLDQPGRIGRVGMDLFLASQRDGKDPILGTRYSSDDEAANSSCRLSNCE